MQTLRYLGYFIRHDRGAQIGFAIIGVMLALVLLAPYLASYDPLEANPNDILQPPSATSAQCSISSGIKGRCRPSLIPPQSVHHFAGSWRTIS